MAREYRTGVKITGDSSGGVRATKAARGELDNLSRAQQRHNSIADRARATFAGGVRAIGAFTLAAGIATGAIGGMAKSVADKGDRIQKLSIQFGTSTEFISGMGHAATLSGSSIEGFEKAFGKMQKSVSDGVAGLTTAVRGFDALGLKAEELQKLKPEDQFLLIADRLGGLDDKSRRVAVSMDLFGRSGRELIPLFEQGAGGIEAMRDEAERLGIVISQDLADASAQFNDDLTRMKGLTEGAKNQFAEGLLPQVTAVIQHFLDGAEASETWTKVGETLGNTVRVLVAAFIWLKETLIVAWETASFVFNSFVTLVAAAVEPIVTSASTIGEAIGRALRGDFLGAGELTMDLPKRVADNWKKAMAGIQQDGVELGKSLKTRVQTAVEDVNDVLTRTPEIAQGAGSAMAAAGDDAEVLGKEAEAAAKRLQSLLDRLDPVAAAARKYAEEQAFLRAQIAASEGDTLELEVALILLRAEYNKNKAAADGYGDAAVDAGQRAIDAAVKERKTRAQELAKSQQDQETFLTAWKRGIERLDDLGADLWRNWFTGATSALESIKQFFQQWLAEMAHAALTRPIIVSFTGAFGGAGNAFAGQGGAGGIPGMAGGNPLSNIGGLFTGNQLGMGFANLPTWLGGTGGTALSPGLAGPVQNAGGLFANAGAIPNWQYGLYGLGGGLLGNALVPNSYAGAGGAFGATAGAAWGAGAFASYGAMAGPIGAAIGAAIGIALGSFFKTRDPSTTIGGAGFPGGTDPRHQRITTPFGEVVSIHARGGVGGFDEAGTFGEQAGQAIQAFDQALFDMISAVSGEEQIAAIQDALTNWGGTWEDGAVTIENILNSRWTAILGTFTGEMQAFVREAEGIEAQVERLSFGLIAEKIIAGAPDLFEGVTFQRFVEVAESMQLAGEDLTTTFARVVQAVEIVTNQLQFLQEFVATDLGQAFDQLITDQGRTLQDVAGGLVDQIIDLRANFTGSADDLAKLTAAAFDFTQVGLQFLNLVEQARAGVTAGTDRFEEQIQHDLLGDEAFYEHLTSRAEELALALRDMTDPAQIAATQAEILRLSQQAYGLLTPEQRRAQGQSFLDFIQGVEADALTQLTEARENFLDDSDFVRGLIDEMTSAFADPLTIVANAHQDAADDHTEAAANLYTAGDHLIDASRGLGSLPDIIGASLQSIALNGLGPDGFAPSGLQSGTPPPSAAAPSAPPPSAPGGGSHLTSIPPSGYQAIGKAVSEAVGEAINRYGSSTVSAILASDRRLKIELRGLPTQRSGRVTR